MVIHLSRNRNNYAFHRTWDPRIRKHAGVCSRDRDCFGISRASSAIAGSTEIFALGKEVSSVIQGHKQR